MKKIALRSDRCPCCGGPLPGTLLAWFPSDGVLVGCGRWISLSPRESEVFDVLWRVRARAEGVTLREIAARVFGADEGPEWELDVLKQYLWRLKYKPKPVGLTVMRIGYGHRWSEHGREGSYRLVRADLLVSPAVPPAAAKLVAVGP